MILGFDHLTLSVENIDLEKKKLEKEDFTCVFFAKNIINHPEKKNLLKHYQVNHDIALFKKNNSNLAIEMTAHGNVSNSSIGSYKYQNSYIQLNTNNLILEKEFWLNALGFQAKESNLIELVSFVPSWSCKIRFNQVDKTLIYCLDSAGYTCIALLTNNLKEDRMKVAQFGAKDITNSFEISVNNQNLDIVMFRTPTGAICELIQIQRGKQ